MKNEIYINKLNLSSDQIKYLVNNNSNIYTCSPLCKCQYFFGQKCQF